MFNKQLGKRIKELIALNEIQEAIKTFQIAVNAKDYQNELILLSARLKENIKNARLAIISREDSQVERHRIQLALLQLADELVLQGVSIPFGKSNLLKISIDESHRQKEWFGSPVVENGLSSSIKLLKDKAITTNILDEKNLPRYLEYSDILIIPTPFGSQIDSEFYEQIADWVFKGNSLLVFGVYLMEEHHYNNFNNLLRRVGIEFNKNLVMSNDKHDFNDCMNQAFGYIEEELWIDLVPIGSPPNHPIMQNIKKLRFLSSCTVEYHRSYDLLIKSSEELTIMKARGEKNEEGRLFRIREYYKDKQEQAPFLVASKHGKGKVVGIGSWKIFLNHFIEDEEIDNRRLFLNIIEWLK